MNPPSAGASTPARDGLWESLHVAGLWALAVAQPVLDLLGRSPEFFIAHRAGATDVVLLCAVVVGAGAVLLVALLAVTRRLDARLHGATLGVVISLLFGLLALQFLRRAALGDEWILAGAALVGICAAIAYLRAAAFRQVVTLLALALLIVPAVFLVRLSAQGVLRSSAGATSVQAEVTADGPSVILVVFDQFPLSSLLDASGSIDARRYPNLATLAGQANWYPAATSVANKTAWAVPAIVTGVYPDPARRLPSFHDYPESVFTLLEGGYALRAHEPVTELCPRGRCRAPRPPLTHRLRDELHDASIVLGHALMPPGMAARLPPVNTGWNAFGQARAGSPRGEAEAADGETAVVSDAGDPGWNFTDRWVSRRDSDRRAGPLEFIRSIHADDRRPTLYFLHALLPHEPYVLLSSGGRYSINDGTPGLMPDGRWQDDPYGIALNYQRFLLQAGYADRLVGMLVERLQEAGLYDSSLLIVTADHGGSFYPGRPFKDPHSSTLSDILSVPLIVKLPGQSEGVIDPREAETVDILPTITEVVGAPAPWPVDGRSLLQQGGAERQEKLHYYGGARGPLRVDPAALRQQLAASVSEKLRLMGPEGDAADGVLFGPHAELLGQATDSDAFRIADLEEGHVAMLHEELLLSHVEPESGFVPRHLNGYVIGDPSRFPTSDLAVAVNGVIRATGKVYPYAFRGRDGYWSVVLPEDALESGYNAVEVFLVIPRDRRTVLRRLYANPLRARPERINLALESAAGLFGMQLQTSGFYAETEIDSLPVRWTNGHGKIRLHIPGDVRWRALEIGLRFVGPRGSEISILVNGCTVYSGTDDEPWIRTFDLGECAPEGTIAVLEIVSSTFEDGPITRGVGVSSIVPREELPRE